LKNKLINATVFNVSLSGNVVIHVSFTGKTVKRILSDKKFQDSLFGEHKNDVTLNIFDTQTQSASVLKDYEALIEIVNLWNTVLRK
jgi:hypothetical protein